MTNIPIKSRKVIGQHKAVRWNTNREGGWDAYKALTTENQVIQKVASSDSRDPEVLMNKFEKEIKNVKFKAFGKVKEGRQKCGDKEIEKLTEAKREATNQEDIEQIDAAVDKLIVRKQREKFESEIEKLKVKSW